MADPVSHIPENDFVFDCVFLDHLLDTRIVFVLTGDHMIQTIEYTGWIKYRITFRSAQSLEAVYGKCSIRFVSGQNKLHIAYSDISCVYITSAMDTHDSAIALPKAPPLLLSIENC